jgi:hypothetical protein
MATVASRPASHTVIFPIPASRPNVERGGVVGSPHFVVMADAHYYSR